MAERPSKPGHPVMSFGEHLEDLRRRVMFAVIGLAPIAVLCMAFGDKVIWLLIRPLEAALLANNQAPNLQTLSPLEAFAAYFKIAMVLTVILGIPWILYQLWLFVAPGLYETERRFVKFLLPFSAVLTLLGTAFLYAVVLPVTLSWLIHFGSGLVPAMAPGVATEQPATALANIPIRTEDPPNPKEGDAWVIAPLKQLRIAQGDGALLTVPLVSGGLISQQYRLSEYIDLIFLLGLIFALGFQTPIVVMLLSWVGIVDPVSLGRQRKYVFFGLMVGAAVLTPMGDPLSLSLVQVPLYLLFELGLVLAKWVPPSRVSRGLLSRSPRQEGSSPSAPAPPGAAMTLPPPEGAVPRRTDGEYGDES